MPTIDGPRSSVVHHRIHKPIPGVQKEPGDWALAKVGGKGPCRLGAGGRCREEARAESEQTHYDEADSVKTTERPGSTRHV